MNRQQFLKRFMLAAAALTIAGLPAFAQVLKGSQVELKPQELQVRATELKLQPTQLRSIRLASSRLVAFNGFAVVQEFTGNFESVAKSYDEFSKEFRDQKIQAAPNQPAILIITDDPSSGQFQYLVGYEVRGKVEPKAPLKLRQMEHPEAVRFTHVGAYEQLGNIHAGVRASVKEFHQKETKFPVVLRLLNDPRKVGPGQRKTEIIVPVG